MLWRISTQSNLLTVGPDPLLVMASVESLELSCVDSFLFIYSHMVLQQVVDLENLVLRLGSVLEALVHHLAFGAVDRGALVVLAVHSHYLFN